MIRSLSSLPSFTGRFLDDEAALAAAARNFGRHAQRRPAAVLAPGSVDDIAALVRFARQHRLPVAARGQGHSTFNQTEADGGVVVDMSALARVREIAETSALVDGGLRWSALLERAIPLGLTPPTLTDYQGLSVAGTLSVGGVGGETHRNGAQVDNVLELEVVTGEGEIVHCSPERDAELFDACRAGLGQCGIITGVRVRLVPAPPRVHVLVLQYGALSAFLADMTALSREARFDHLYGNITALEGGGWDHEIVATRHLGSDDIDDARLLAGLSPGSVTARDMTYADFTVRVEDYVVMMKRTGTWELPHPWLDVFVRASDAASTIAGELAQLTPDTLGGGGILVYPLRRSRCSAPFFRLPDEEDLFLLDVLRNAAPPTAEHVEALVEANGRSYRALVERGATLYCIGSTPMGSADWQRHFGASWARFAAAKRRFDPDGILTPGPGIFPAP